MMPWPAPLPLSGVKSKKREIFGVKNAVVTLDGKPCEVAEVSINLQSRIFAVGKAGRAVVALLLGEQEPASGEVPARHKDLTIAHLTPQNGSEIAKNPSAFIADVLSKRPQIVVIDEEIANGGDAWDCAFKKILQDEVCSFEGAIVIYCSNEDSFAQLHCSTRWMATGSLVKAEDMCRVNSTNIKGTEKLCSDDKDDAVLEKNQAPDKAVGLPGSTFTSEMAGLRLKELRNRAKAKGVHADLLEEAMDDHDPKAAIIKLLVDVESKQSASPVVTGKDDASQRTTVTPPLLEDTLGIGGVQEIQRMGGVTVSPGLQKLSADDTILLDDVQVCYEDAKPIGNTYLGTFRNAEDDTALPGSTSVGDSRKEEDDTALLGIIAPRSSREEGSKIGDVRVPLGPQQLLENEIVMSPGPRKLLADEIEVLDDVQVGSKDAKPSAFLVGLLEEVSALSLQIFQEDVVEKIRSMPSSNNPPLVLALLVQKDSEKAKDKPDKNCLLSFLVYRLWEPPVKTFTIYYLAVLPHLRGLGYGKQMVKWAISRAREMPRSMCSAVTCSSLAEAIPFYRRLGFFTDKFAEQTIRDSEVETFTPGQLFMKYKLKYIPPSTKSSKAKK